MNTLSIQELSAHLKTLGIPVAYSHFQQGEHVKLPFICYLDLGSDNIQADNIAYVKVKQVRVELYFNKKDYELEERLERLFDELGLYYNAYEHWIAYESMFQREYELELVKPGNEPVA